jgi:hypothetical protein
VRAVVKNNTPSQYGSSACFGSRAPGLQDIATPLSLSAVPPGHWLLNWERTTGLVPRLAIQGQEDARGGGLADDELRADAAVNAGFYVIGQPRGTQAGGIER